MKVWKFMLAAISPNVGIDRRGMKLLFLYQAIRKDASLTHEDYQWTLSLQLFPSDYKPHIV
jgi:hypothetical protein